MTTRANTLRILLGVQAAAEHWHAVVDLVGDAEATRCSDLAAYAVAVEDSTPQPSPLGMACAGA